MDSKPPPLPLAFSAFLPSRQSLRALEPTTVSPPHRRAREHRVGDAAPMPSPLPSPLPPPPPPPLVRLVCFATPPLTLPAAAAGLISFRFRRRTQCAAPLRARSLPARCRRESFTDSRYLRYCACWRALDCVLAPSRGAAMWGADAACAKTRSTVTATALLATTTQEHILA